MKNLFKRKDRYKYKKYCKRKYKYRKEENQYFFISINFITFSRYSSNVKVPHPHPLIRLSDPSVIPSPEFLSDFIDWSDWIL